MPANCRQVQFTDFRNLRAAADVLINETPGSVLGWSWGAGVPQIYLESGACPLLPDIEAAHVAVDQVRQLNRDLGIPPRLRDVGVRVSGIPKLSTAAMTSGNIAVNPRKTTMKDIEQLFKSAI